MSADQPAARPPRVLNAFIVFGDILWLQLLFVAAALPIVTMFPAAIALQRSLRDVFLDGRPRPTALFWENLKWAWARTWKVALVPPLLLVVSFTSLVFWLAAERSVGVVALCILVPLYGAAAALYLAVLSSSMSAVRSGTLQDWWQAALVLFRDRALPLGVSIFVLATWFLLLSKLPTLVLVGTGLVPAGLAWWVAGSWIRQHRDATSNS